MISQRLPINLFLCFLLLLSVGCKTTEEKKQGAKNKEKSKEATIVRLYLEANRGSSQKIATC
jgi:hypothetical protein